MRNIKVAHPSIEDAEIDAMAEVVRSGFLCQGKNVKEFEAKFAKYIGTKYAVAVNGGTAALHLALLSIGVGPADEVIVPSMSFFATVEAILYTGATPVFCDVDEYCNINTYHASNLINKKTKAIIPVHLYGMPCDMKELCRIANATGVHIIEDAAQAHGAAINNRKVGSFGTAGCFSFFATKNMTTMEGGIITTNDSDIAYMCEKLRCHGMTDRDTHRYLGYNYKMPDASAALGIHQLAKLDNMNATRRKHSIRIIESLKGSKTLFPHVPKEGYLHAYFWCPVYVNERRLGMTTDEFRKELQSNHGIGTRHRYNVPLYKQPVLDGAYSKLMLSGAERYSGKMIGLPNHPGMTDEDTDYIIKVLGEYK